MMDYYYLSVISNIQSNISYMVNCVIVLSTFECLLYVSTLDRTISEVFAKETKCFITHSVTCVANYRYFLL